MALVGYSDSEESDVDTSQAPAIASKRLERSKGQKIKIDLSSLSSKINIEQSEPAPKKQRIGGAFSGFNSLLPPPKRTTQSALKSGISLRTSSEAAFSRVAPPPPTESNASDAAEESPRITAPVSGKPAEEPKLVGKTTRFLPLSVSNAKKKKRPPTSQTSNPRTKSGDAASAASASASTPAPKVRQSLFSMSGNEAQLSASTDPYEPEFAQTGAVDPERAEPAHTGATTSQTGHDSALDSVASDLQLSASDRRRLFGRQRNQSDVQIAHFNMDAEYRSNQDLAAKGEATEHRSVKAIAPGKHSLQQLVNNVQGQTDALEDKWADGRRNKGEAGNKYGW